MNNKTFQNIEDLDISNALFMFPLPAKILLFCGRCQIEKVHIAQMDARVICLFCFTQNARII